MTVVHETITPASLGCRRLGHLGFLRRPAGEFFWRRAAEWLIPRDDDAPCDESLRIPTEHDSAGADVPARE
jgi:hypothetical protein